MIKTAHNPFWEHVRRMTASVELRVGRRLKPESIDAAMVVTALFRAFEEGDHDAYDGLKVAATEGIRQSLYGEIKRVRSRVKTADGDTLQVPLWIGIDVLDGEGNVIALEQLPWIEATREQLERFVEREMTRRDQADRNIAAFKRVLHLFALCPAARTAGEACEALGVDWRRVELPEVA